MVGTRAEEDSQPVTRYFTTETGILEWVARPDAPLPDGVTGELTEAEYRDRLAGWEANQEQLIQEVRDAERAEADQDVAALVAAGIPEDSARRLAGHPDADHPVEGADPPPGGEG